MLPGVSGKKQGTCTSLSAAENFVLSRRAFEGITRPWIFRKLDNSIILPASVVEGASLKANPELELDMFTIACKQCYIEDVRLCLSRDLLPVPCCWCLAVAK